MNYNILGKTGLRVSEIALGCEGFAAEDGVHLEGLIDEAERRGINYIDLYTTNPQLRSRLGEALRGRRNKFMLQAHIGSVWYNGQYKRSRQIDEVRAGFEDLLTRLETDYAEVGMIHYVDEMEDWQEIFEGPVMEYAKELKAKGTIGCIGLSSHNPLVALEAVKTGLIEVLMFSVNPCYDLQPGSEDAEQLWAERSYEGRLLNMDTDRQQLYELCQRMGVGISVMKALGGGDLLDKNLSPAAEAMTLNQCLHYALTRPAVATIMSGARNVKELEISAGYSQAKEEDKDFSQALAAFPKISWSGHCMYCGHCAPCPEGIDVAMVTKLLNLVKAQGEMPETVREHYAALDHKAAQCKACGACEKRCPFEVPVVENMKRAAEVFGK